MPTAARPNQTGPRGSAMMRAAVSLLLILAQLNITHAGDAGDNRSDFIIPNAESIQPIPQILVGHNATPPAAVFDGASGYGDRGGGGGGGGRGGGGHGGGGGSLEPAVMVTNAVGQPWPCASDLDVQSPEALARNDERLKCMQISDEAATQPENGALCVVITHSNTDNHPSRSSGGLHGSGSGSGSGSGGGGGGGGGGSNSNSGVVMHKDQPGRDQTYAQLVATITLVSVPRNADFFEKQEGLFCGAHAINNAHNGPVVTPVQMHELERLCRERSQQEITAVTNVGRAHDEAEDVDLAGEQSPLGNFQVQLMESVCRQLGTFVRLLLSVVPARPSPLFALN